jgi:uncharacterized protein YkuJ
VKDDNGKSKDYFGKGEKFILRMYNEREKYKWVGMDCDKGDYEIDN